MSYTKNQINNQYKMYIEAINVYTLLCIFIGKQSGLPRENKGPRAELKWGLRGKEDSTLNHNFSLAVSRRP